MGMREDAMILLPDASAELLDFACRLTEEYIKSSCHIAEIPRTAEALAAQMAAACYEELQAGGHTVHSVSRGDFSVTYDALAPDALRRFYHRLSPYRTMSW